ncbi:hypothetical protein H7J77_01665 [Mycolicibacillus parakoreensis]|uniref:Predicted hydrolase N-terminal domain-containing protein n=1 Tax=Mycolicibacillus parakoreensis TaxID=1069221 RepID=A0ABY3U1F1_9MYCO|nr:hypothetical protein [Mycolicibacillus parakoreensis]MCV7314258.1 hypothetical protein [Mycolicibacillus parakoreensis]ULN52969.1 hypothetical protein MIU77_00820 [Mycolicibacillus parakoreensis]
MEPPALVNLDIAQLWAEAGGDPWKLNDEVQAGDPAEINNLADAFHNSLACIEETDANWVQAKQRFQQAYQHDGGSRHPINESAEVIATTEQLHLQRGQIEQIAVGLETIATALATAQTDSEAALAWPHVALHFLDEAISAAEADGLDTTAYYNSAVTVVREALDEITGIRSTYTTVLSTQEAVMAASTGYHPGVIDDFDGADEDDPAPAAQRYDQTHRDADQALVDHAQQTGEWTDDARAAAARLRDSATVADPDAPAEARKLAGERLDDYNNATFIGPTGSKDSVLGWDSRTRAQNRLEAQRMLQTPDPDLDWAGMTPDQATKFLDQAEALLRDRTLGEFAARLQAEGVSPEGAQAAVDAIRHGVSPREFFANASSAVGSVGTGIGHQGRSLPTGVHNWTSFSEADAKALKTLGSRIGLVGNALDGLVTVNDILRGEAWQPAVERLAGRTGGSILGGWAAGAAWGTLVGPEGTLIVGALGALAGGIGGDKAVGWMIGE